MARKERRPARCEFCDEYFPADRRSCPHCGSDATTGWLSPEDQGLHSIALPASSLSDEDYDRFLESEALSLSGQQKRRRQLLLLLLLTLAVVISLSL